jgi:hypothetical protein
MPLKMRPTGLGHGVYKDDLDYGVFCGEWCIGPIYQTRDPEIIAKNYSPDAILLKTVSRATIGR